MDQRGAGNDFLLRERWNGTPITPFPRPYNIFRPRESSRKATWTTTHGPAMTESDYCLHGWNTDHDYLIPEWITIPEVAAVLKITCKRWMEKTCSVVFSFLNHVQTIMYCSVQVLMSYVLDGSCSGLDLFVTN